MKDGAYLAATMTLALAVILLANAALAQDIERGRRLANIRCTSCHTVDGPVGATSTVARSFSVIANQPFLDGGRLRGWLAAPHPQMPDPDLEDREISDLVAYILSLKRR